MSIERINFPHIENEKSQLDKRKEAARQLDLDDGEERFEKKLKKLVKQRPKDKQKATSDD